VIVGNRVKKAALQIDRQAERVKDYSVRLGGLLVQRYRRPCAEGSFARDRSRTNLQLSNRTTRLASGILYAGPRH